MPHEISESLFENWVDTFASRIGREMAPHAQVALYRGLCRVFVSDAAFHAAAQHVYEHWQSWNSWPAPIEFESAAATLRRIPDAEVRETYRRVIAPSRALLPAATRGSQAFEDWAGPDGWRAGLAHCRTDTAAQRRARSPGAWLTDETRPLPHPDDLPDAHDVAAD